MMTVSPCLTNGGGLMATGMLQQRSDRRVLPPFVREAGTGPGVVCLHANASTSGTMAQDSWTGWRRPSTCSRRMPTMLAGVPNGARTESVSSAGRSGPDRAGPGSRRLAAETRLQGAERNAKGCQAWMIA